MASFVRNVVMAFVDPVYVYGAKPEEEETKDAYSLQASTIGMYKLASQLAAAEATKPTIDALFYEMWACCAALINTANGANVDVDASLEELARWIPCSTRHRYATMMLRRATFVTRPNFITARSAFKIPPGEYAWHRALEDIARLSYSGPAHTAAATILRRVAYIDDRKDNYAEQVEQAVRKGLQRVYEARLPDAGKPTVVVPVRLYTHALRFLPSGGTKIETLFSVYGGDERTGTVTGLIRHAVGGTPIVHQYRYKTTDGKHVFLASDKSGLDMDARPFPLVPPKKQTEQWTQKGSQPNLGDVQWPQPFHDFDKHIQVQREHQHMVDAVLPMPVSDIVFAFSVSEAYGVAVGGTSAAGSWIGQAAAWIAKFAAANGFETTGVADMISSGVAVLASKFHFITSYGLSLAVMGVYFGWKLSLQIKHRIGTLPHDSRFRDYIPDIVQAAMFEGHTLLRIARMVAFQPQYAYDPRHETYMLSVMRATIAKAAPSSDDVPLASAIAVARMLIRPGSFMMSTFLISAIMAIGNITLKKALRWLARHICVVAVAAVPAAAVGALVLTTGTTPTVGEIAASAHGASDATGSGNYMHLATVVCMYALNSIVYRVT